MAFDSRPAPYFTIESPLTDGIRTAAYPRGPSLDSVHARMAVVLAGMSIVGFFFVLLLNQNVNLASAAAGESSGTMSEESAPEAAVGSSSGGEVAAVSGVLSKLFTREVLHWEPQIVAWSALHGVDPNLAAIIMQIESCGDPGAVSGAGAQGLFQVMPFHFTNGENMQDPDTNAARGLRYFADRLAQTNGDVGRAFAGYNGGHVAAAASWDSWANETQRYYTWSTGIYGDIMSGGGSSPTLDSWLAAGGASLCQQAATRLGLQ
jgi:soluble lytic murein transglycosylase-like protein